MGIDFSNKTYDFKHTSCEIFFVPELLLYELFMVRHVWDPAERRLTN